MSSSALRNRWGLVGLAAIAIAATAAAPASAAPAEGKAKIILAKQKKGNGLIAQGIRMSPLTLPVADLEPGQASTVRTTGSLKLALGKRSTQLRGLVLQSSGRNTTVSAKLGKRRLNFFRAKGQAQVDTSSLKLDAARFSLTGNGAKALKGKLGLEKLSPGKIGTLSVDARLTGSGGDSAPAEPQPAPEQPKPQNLDPYFAQCGLSATSKANGALPPAEDLPILGGAKDTVGSDVSWGFKESFRGYIIGSGGSIKGLDGATTNPPGSPFPSSFAFPTAPGQYADNDLIDTADDQAVINGTGAALFCNKPHGFRVVISNPTIVIDGEDSRIVADVDTNMSGLWTSTQRVDLADLDLSGVTPFYNYSGAEITWSNVPAALTETGVEAICGADTHCTYAPGEELDPITAQAKLTYDSSDLDALATYVEDNLPFPLIDPAIGGCTLQTPIPTPLVIDDPGSGINWLDPAPNLQPLPPLGGSAEEVDSGGLDWGVRSSLRTTVNMTGEFNLANGATASDEYFGNGGSGTRSMNGASKFFTWPAAASGSLYDAGGPGNADDRLILRTQGRVALCQSDPTRGSYGTVLSNPTVIIDGDKSRLTIDVATRYRFSWVRGVVDFATLDLSGATFASDTEEGTTTVSWTFPNASGTPAVGPVALSKGGELVFRMLSVNTYVEGLGLDGTTIKASFPEAD